MSGKSKNAPKKNAENDIEKLDRYESVRSDDELKKYNTIKTALFFVGIVFLFVAVFLPSDNSYHATHKVFVNVFATVNVVALIYALYMLFQENRKHKIRKTVLKKQAPRYGFDSGFTYPAFEIFCVLTVVLLAEQCAIVAFARDGYAIAGLCLMVVCVGCVAASRFVLVKANKGCMRLIEVEKKDEKESEKTDPITKTEISDKSEEISERSEPVSGTDNEEDDFYAPPKE